MDRQLDLIYPTPVASIHTGKIDMCAAYSKLIVDSMSPQDLEQYNLTGFYTTSDSLHLDSNFQSLIDLINQENKKLFENILHINFNDVKLQNMWSNTYMNQTKHHVHQHPNSFYSGVFYLELPSGEGTDPGKLFFHDPRPAAAMQVADYTEETLLNYRSWWYTPTVGSMILFPSWLPHGTEAPAMPADQRRMSISWNYILTKSSVHTMKLYKE